ncbi:WD40-repeat-containing domain protein [Halteromyces radiatus]|uniref:WD40-repeat-containing domain protein n=1 Tax=Halteromyces radiatus TaxID=101107 RepID=UPI0022200721|nr:WD40-repeat-containing domain protein [Halteromyces radiatus]KAI8089222.1 WD40-repeat-containing domain protein [Halteromyces radiatus]
MVLSEYEKKRLENIQRNQELLKSLEVPMRPAETDLKKTKAPAIKKHHPKKHSAPTQPRRVSARIRGIAAKQMEVDENDTVVNRPSSPVKIERVDTLNEKDHAHFLEMVGSVNTDNSYDQEDIKVDPSLEPLKEQLDNLTIRHEWATVKMTPDRISHCLFHPNKTKLLAIATSSTGHLSFWDINNKEEETGDPVVYSYRPDTRGITDAKFCINDPLTLYTSSYDGSIQTFDMNKASFGSVMLSTNDYPITSFDMTQNGQVLYFSTGDGQLGIRDLRSDKTETMLTLRDKKIGCIHLNPVHSHLLVAASNDRTATIWDTRHLSKHSKKNVQELEHGFAVTSAYWSPSGKQLATSCYDDYLRVFDLNKTDHVDLKGRIRHNCHTGKWVTMFRTKWNENRRFGIDHPHFIVGNMNHPCSVFSAETVSKLTDLYDEDRITAIPAVNEFHPTLDSLALLSANASGRVVCWT